MKKGKAMVLNRLSFLLIISMSILWVTATLAQDKVVVIPLVSDCDATKTVASAGGRVWMDRDLGAVRVAQSEDDYQAYGWLYQWGRLADGHEDRGSETTAILSPDDDPLHNDFITENASPYDWRISQNNNLWQEVSDLNNPCPAGFRIPTLAEWLTEKASWSSDNSAGAFESPLRLVKAGYRRYTDGELINADYLGGYWSSTVDGGNAHRLYFATSYANTGPTGRANGLNVRCIKD